MISPKEMTDCASRNNKLNWSDETTSIILSDFIREQCKVTEFRKYIQRIVKEDLEEIKKSEG